MLPVPCPWRRENMFLSVPSPIPRTPILNVRSASSWRILVREGGACADLCRARCGASPCPRGCQTTDGQGCIGSSCARRARYFRNQHGAPGSSRVSLGCNLLSWSSGAPCSNAALATILAAPRRFSGFVGLPGDGYDRRKDRGRRDPSANDKGRVLGRSRDGFDRWDWCLGWQGRVTNGLAGTEAIPADATM